MAVDKRSISLSQELGGVLDGLAEKRDQSFSELLEMLAREHPLVRRQLKEQRGLTN